MDNPIVKISITNDNESILVDKDFSQLTSYNSGLIGQLITELEILKQDLLIIYSEEGEEH